MKESKSFEDQLGEMTTEDLEHLWESLNEDLQVLLTNEGFKLLSSVISVWRPDLKEELIILLEEIKSISKEKPHIAFASLRGKKLLKRYFDLINEISEEAELRKTTIGLLQKELPYFRPARRSHLK